MSNAIEVRGLRKTFRVAQRREPGFRSAVRSLVQREYREVTAVAGIDLTVPSGEIRALIGPNGAGKSTTIKALTGILHPTEGEVTCLGMTPWTDRASYVRRIGTILGQKTQLLWDLPTVDTFALNQKLYRIPKSVFQANLEYFVDTFGLAKVLATPVRNLSLGERMKCELTAALLHDPELVFLDEPTIGLDILAKDAVRALVKQVNQDRQVTFLLTTHDLDDVENLCRRVSVINNGHVVFDRTLDELRGGVAAGKVLKLAFRSPVSEAALRDWSVISHTGLTCELSLDGEVSEHPAKIATILASLPVLDIEIHNPDIESIIRELYAETARF